MANAIPSWAKEQIHLRRIVDDWIDEEINTFELEGYQKLFGSKAGHDLDECGGYTRNFVASYCLSGNKRIPLFIKTFRDEWYRALYKREYFYHGYASNPHGDYITHTAEPFTHFLLNALYLDPTDKKTIAFVEDAAEHLGNWNPDVQNWYDWEKHVFLSYFLGTKSPFHIPPYNFQTPRHFRVLQIAVAAYEVTSNQRYLDLCEDYCDFWAKHLLSATNALDVPTRLFLITPDEFERYSKNESFSQSWRYKYYHVYPSREKALSVMTNHDAPCVPAWPIKDLKSPYFIPHDLVMTLLEVYKYLPKESYKNSLHRVLKGWIHLGEDSPSQFAGIESHVGVHLPKYRDFTGDTSLDELYLKQWQNGPCSYLLTGEEKRLEGIAPIAAHHFETTLIRNKGILGEEEVCHDGCSIKSNAGTSSSHVAPALYLPIFGGLNVHFGRAPWVNVLYYTNGNLGLPAKVAALFLPIVLEKKSHVKLVNLDTKPHKIGIRKVVPDHREILHLQSPPVSDQLTEVTIAPNETKIVYF